jgi:hypothetical protein
LILAIAKSTQSPTKYLKEYSILRGQIINQDSDSILVYTTLGKSVVLAKNDIKRIENGSIGNAIDTKKDIVNVGYIVDNAYSVPKGKIIFTSNFLIFSKVQYGLSDNITLQSGIFFMPNFVSEIAHAPGVKGLFHKSISKKLEVAGTFGAFIPWNGDGFLNHIGAILTYGGKEKNISVGIHKLINAKGPLTMDLPRYDITVKYTYRPAKKIAFGLETYYSKYEQQAQIFIVPSIDWYFKSAVFSFTLNVQRNKYNSFVLPFVGLKIPVNFMI